MKDGRVWEIAVTAQLSLVSHPWETAVNNDRRPRRQSTDMSALRAFLVDSTLHLTKVVPGHHEVVLLGGLRRIHSYVPAVVATHREHEYDALYVPIPDHHLIELY